MILAIDFDLTICSDSKFGPPMDGAVKILNQLKVRGHTIVVHTSKANSESGKAAVTNWLRLHYIRFDDVVGKFQADVYIDDKAIRFEDWEQVWTDLKIK